MKNQTKGLSCRDELLPVPSIKEKFKLARRLGFDAIELHGSNIWAMEKEILSAYDNGAVFSNISAGYFGSLADSRKNESNKAYKSACYLLEFGAKIKVTGLVIIPFWGQSFSTLSPLADIILHEDKLVKHLRGLCDLASKLKMNIFLESVNRYESPVFNRLDDMAHLISRVNSPNIKILADFFHMNIEESSIEESLNKYSSLIGLIHLADSNRLAPGEGHIDFRRALKCLMEIGFKGYMSFECKGKIDIRTLKKSVKYIREIIEKK